MAKSFYHEKDYSGVHGYVSGQPISPHTVCEAFDFDGIGDVGALDPMSLDVKALQRTSEEFEYRMAQDLSFDMSERLVAVIRGHRAHDVIVGRSWSATKGGFKVKFEIGQSWGHSQLALIPAIAGVTSPMLDKAQMEGWAMLLALLGQAGGNVALDTNMTSMLRGVHKSSANPVRFVWRMAALYLHALHQPMQTANVTSRIPPLVQQLGLIANLTAHMQNGTTGSNFVPWFTQDTSNRNADILQVLKMAASDRVVCGGAGAPGNNVPTRFLSMWPEMSNVTVLTNLPAAGIVAGLNNATLSPQQIWNAAYLWCLQYSDPALLYECVENQMVLAYSPDIGSNCCMWNKITVRLPAAMMGPYSAGPALEPVNDLSTSPVPAAPKLARMAEPAILRSMALGLINWEQVWGMAGLVRHFKLGPDSDIMEWAHRYRATGHVIGAWRVVQANLNRVIQGKIGRILCTVRPTDETEILRLQKKTKIAPQWEEILSRVKKAPADAYIYGTCYPMSLKRSSTPRGVWARVGSIEGNRDPVQGYFSLLGAADIMGAPVMGDHTDVGGGNIEWRMEVAGALGGVTTDLHVARSYRGVPIDSAIKKTLDCQGRTVEPIFRVLNPALYTMLTEQDGDLFKFRWYYEEPSGAPVKISAGPFIPDLSKPPDLLLDSNPNPDRNTPPSSDVDESDDDGGSAEADSEMDWHTDPDNKSKKTGGEHADEREGDDSGKEKRVVTADENLEQVKQIRKAVIEGRLTVAQANEITSKLFPDVDDHYWAKNTTKAQVPAVVASGFESLDNARQVALDFKEAIKTPKGKSFMKLDQLYTIGFDKELLDAAASWISGADLPMDASQEALSASRDKIAGYSLVQALQEVLPPDRSRAAEAWAGVLAECATLSKRPGSTLEMLRRAKGAAAASTVLATNPYLTARDWYNSINLARKIEAQKMASKNGWTDGVVSEGSLNLALEAGSHIGMMLASPKDVYLAQIDDELERSRLELEAAIAASMADIGGGADAGGASGTSEEIQKDAASVEAANAGAQQSVGEPKNGDGAGEIPPLPDSGASGGSVPKKGGQESPKKSGWQAVAQSLGIAIAKKSSPKSPKSSGRSTGEKLFAGAMKSPGPEGSGPRVEHGTKSSTKYTPPQRVAEQPPAQPESPAVVPRASAPSPQSPPKTPGMSRSGEDQHTSSPGDTGGSGDRIHSATFTDLSFS